jgi:ATP-dependent RNA helicase DHX37/DHR1
MENKPNIELSEELMKELKINSIEEYNNIVMADKKTSKTTQNSKKIQKITNKSKTQIKLENRKKEQIIQKRRKNEARNSILNSLAQYNTEEALKKLENLESSRNLNLRKRKFSKDLSHRLSIDSKLKNEGDEIDSNDDNLPQEDEEKIDSDIEDDGINKEEATNKAENTINNEKKDEHIKQEKSFDIVNDIKDPWKLLDVSVRNQIITEIRSFRDKESTIDATLDEENINDIEIPPKDKTVLVKRNEEIDQSRLELPIIKYEQELMDCINHSLVTIISGETGSGKSTQIPQFIYEYGYTKTFGHIAITQPRRLAAVALSNRVAVELNLNFGKDVGYQIRYDSQNCTENTEIKVKIFLI